MGQILAREPPPQPPPWPNLTPLFVVSRNHVSISSDFPLSISLVGLMVCWINKFQGMKDVYFRLDGGRIIDLASILWRRCRSYPSICKGWNMKVI